MGMNITMDKKEESEKIKKGFYQKEELPGVWFFAGNPDNAELEDNKLSVRIQTSNININIDKHSPLRQN